MSKLFISPSSEKIQPEGRSRNQQHITMINAFVADDFSVHTRTHSREHANAHRHIAHTFTRAPTREHYFSGFFFARAHTHTPRHTHIQTHILCLCLYLCFSVYLVSHSSPLSTSSRSPLLLTFFLRSAHLSPTASFQSSISTISLSLCSFHMPGFFRIRAVLCFLTHRSLGPTVLCVF